MICLLLTNPQPFTCWLIARTYLCLLEIFLGTAAWGPVCGQSVAPNLVMSLGLTNDMHSSINQGPAQDWFSIAVSQSLLISLGFGSGKSDSFKAGFIHSFLVFNMLSSTMFIKYLLPGIEQHCLNYNLSVVLFDEQIILKFSMWLFPLFFVLVPCYFLFVVHLLFIYRIN